MNIWSRCVAQNILKYFDKNEQLNLKLFLMNQYDHCIQTNSVYLPPLKAKSECKSGHRMKIMMPRIRLFGKHTNKIRLDVLFLFLLVSVMLLTNIGLLGI